LLCGAPAQAATNNFIAPAFRGQPNSEAGYWEVFSVAYGPPGNTADQAGSNSGAILTQTASPSAFTTGSGNIYDPVAITAFRVTDATPFTLGTVVLQVRSLGSEVDYDAVRLTYIDGFGAHALEPNLRLELDRGTILGASVSALWQWDLQGLNVTDYSLSFASADPSLSLDAVTVDTWDQFMVIPEPSSVTLLFLGACVLFSRIRHEK
jgi:hypothetical protein